MHILTAEPETASVIAGSWIGDKQVGGDTSFAVRNPYSGDVVATVSHPTPEQVETALDQAWAARAVLASLPAYRRSDALRHVATRMLERRDEFATTITWESGKPIRWAHAEVERASATFRWAAEEALRWSGELQRLDSDPSAEGRLALVRRVPRGPVLGITPFNFPLNLVAHKVAPALAVGAPIVLKPAPKTPLSALLLGELLAECDLPAGAFAVLTVTNDAAPALVTDRRLPVVSFTGSVPVGWSIRDTVPRKHVALELGGNAAVLVCADWGGEEDLAAAAHRVALCANYQGGQSCISVQRVFVDRTLYPRFVDLLVDAVGDLAVGDPWAERNRGRPAHRRDCGAARRVVGGRSGARRRPSARRRNPVRLCRPTRRSRRRAGGLAESSATRYSGPFSWSSPWTVSTTACAASTTPASASRPGCSPATSRSLSARTASSRSVVSSWATCPRSAPSRCPTGV